MSQGYGHGERGPVAVGVGPVHEQVTGVRRRGEHTGNLAAVVLAEEVGCVLHVHSRVDHVGTGRQAERAHWLEAGSSRRDLRPGALRVSPLVGVEDSDPRRSLETPRSCRPQNSLNTLQSLWSLRSLDTLRSLRPGRTLWPPWPEAVP